MIWAKVRRGPQPSRIMGKKNDEAQDMSLYDQFLEGAGDPHDRDVH